MAKPRAPKGYRFVTLGKVRRGDILFWREGGSDPAEGLIGEPIPQWVVPVYQVARRIKSRPASRGRRRGSK